MTEPQIKTTTDAGAQAESDGHSLTVGPDGPRSCCKITT
jgi:hypothetical protein